MPKVLSMTPTENESPEAFAERAAGQIQEFFGGEGAAPEAEAEEPAAEPTDETAEPETETEEQPQ